MVEIEVDGQVECVPTAVAAEITALREQVAELEKERDLFREMVAVNKIDKKDQHLALLKAVAEAADKQVAIEAHGWGYAKAAELFAEVGQNGNAGICRAIEAAKKGGAL